jgi:hypothetical protein
MFDFSQTLAKIGRFLSATPRRKRKVGRGSAPNCCSTEFYARSQRSAFRTRSQLTRTENTAVPQSASRAYAVSDAVSGLFQRLIHLGGTLKISPEKSESIVTVSLPWEAKDASTSATGS